MLVVHGNHEIIDVLGDFRYATKGAYASALGTRRRSARSSSKNSEKRTRRSGDAERQPGSVARACFRACPRLFLPGGEMAIRMAKNPTVLQVGDTVFAHAGIDMRVVEYGFQALNDDVAAWMAGVKSALPPNMVSRRRASCGRASTAAPGRRRYRRGVRLPPPGRGAGRGRRKRLVVGHTPQQGASRAGAAAGSGARTSASRAASAAPAAGDRRFVPADASACSPRDTRTDELSRTQ